MEIFGGSSTLLALALVIAVQVVYTFVRARRMRRLMPPAPPGIPFLGNALQVPKEQPFRQFREWASTYGPVFSLNLAGKPVVVLNTLQAANDLLDRRSAIYSDRPRLIVVGDIMAHGMSMIFMPYGPEWRNERKIAHKVLNACEALTYRTIQKQEALNLVLRLLDDPEHYVEHYASGKYEVSYLNIQAFVRPIYIVRPPRKV